MYSNFISGPQTSANDRQKQKIQQDDYIAVTIANALNISNARKEQMLNPTAPQQLPMIDTMSPAEILADEGNQEMLAQQNLKTLKFRDQEIADIMVSIRRDPQLSFLLLNSNFPAIKAEIEKRFNTKLVTPTFFIDFLKAYLVKVEKSLGLRQYARTKNSSVDTVEEIKTILPDVNDLRFLRDMAQNLNYDDVSLAALDDLISEIPDEQGYAQIAALNSVNRQQVLQEILVVLKDLPTNEQISSLVQGIENGSVDKRSLNDAMRKLINSINITFRKPEFREEIVVPPTPTRRPPFPPRPTRKPPLTPPLQEIEQEARQMLKQRLENPEMELLPLLSRDKPITGLNNPAQLTLKEIKSYLKENPDIAFQLKDKNGRRVKINNLSKKMGDNTKNTSIYQTNLFEIWGQDLPTTEGYGIGSMNMIQKQPRNTIRLGKGIAAVEQPSWCEFGKFVINRHHLENQDIFNVKYKNCLGSVPSFKPTAISDIYRDFVIDLLDNSKANMRVYNQVSDEEKKHFEKVASAAGIFRGLGLPKTIIDDDEQMVKRFELLKGQITAGNNNPKLLDETRKLVIKLMNSDRIKRKQGLDILLELSAM